MGVRNNDLMETIPIFEGVKILGDAASSRVKYAKVVA